MSRSLGKRVAVTLRMPTVLRDRLTALAEAEGVSLNDWMSARLAKAVLQEDRDLVADYVVAKLRGDQPVM